MAKNDKKINMQVGVEGDSKRYDVKDNKAQLPIDETFDIDVDVKSNQLNKQIANNGYGAIQNRQRNFSNVNKGLSKKDSLSNGGNKSNSSGSTIIDNSLDSDLDNPSSDNVVNKNNNVPVSSQSVASNISRMPNGNKTSSALVDPSVGTENEDSEIDSSNAISNDNVSSAIDNDSIRNDTAEEVKDTEEEQPEKEPEGVSEEIEETDNNDEEKKDDDLTDDVAALATSSEVEKGLDGSNQVQRKTPDIEDKNKGIDNPDETGNGYGAIQNRQNKKVSSGDSTESARKNQAQANRESEGKRKEDGEDKKTKSSSGSINTPTKPSLGDRIKNGLKGKANSILDNSAIGAAKSKIDDAKGKINKAKRFISFLAKHPYLLLIIAVALVVLFIIFLVAVEYNSSSNTSGKCSYNLKGVTSTGSVDLDNLKVELINCDGTASNYKVLETVDFEKYALGVALAEIGPDSPDEAIKAQIIMARSFALTRNSSMCPSNPDNCFYGYNASTGVIRMRACEADQVYWDYTKPIYRLDRGAISLYSPEVDASTSGATMWKNVLSDERMSQIQALADEVKGKVLLDSSGNVIHTGYKSTDQVDVLTEAKNGATYEEILETKYGSSNINSSNCSVSGNIDYGDYVLSSDGDTIISGRLDEFLEDKGTSLTEFNNLIKKNVDKAGYGTKAGVVAAAVTLIAELGNNYDVRIPYYLSGGHGHTMNDGTVDGVASEALGYWGDNSMCPTYYGYGNSYKQCGLDCSGFVPWAISTGGFNISPQLAGGFQNISGAKRVSLSSSSAVLEPGDLLESSGHIVLVVGVDSTGYITAEAMGLSQGVAFGHRSFADSGYWGVKMDDYYSTHKKGD